MRLIIKKLFEESWGFQFVVTNIVYYFWTLCRDGMTETTWFLGQSIVSLPEAYRYLELVLFFFASGIYLLIKSLLFRKDK